MAKPLRTTGSDNSRSSFTPTVWAVGGGKGGIGKSFVSSSLAVCLVRMGKSVTLVDLDLGSANLHTLLCNQMPKKTLSDFVTGQEPDLRKLAVETALPGLSLISGSSDHLAIANLAAKDSQRLIDGLRSLKSHYILLDLGAGTAASTLEFFLAADQKIVAVTPEPTAIENAYRFMKSAFYLKLRKAEEELGVGQLLESVMHSRNENGIRTPADLLRYLHTHNPEVAKRLSQKTSEFRPSILLNQVRTLQDSEIGQTMCNVTQKYFGCPASFVGHIEYDNAVWQSLRKRRPLVMEFPYNGVVGQLQNITRNLMEPRSLQAAV